jgi:SAM-dependent methyltransferase
VLTAPEPPSVTERRDALPPAPIEPRPLAWDYPDLDRLASEFFQRTQNAKPDLTARSRGLLTILRRIVPLRAGDRVLVIGCGPVPQIARVLAAEGFAVECVEPVREFVDAARAYLGPSVTVHQGAAEALPVAEGSFRAVFLESVLEHVDSPTRSLAELYRVLEPGGVTFVTTTNRLRFSWRGDTSEYRIPFFNLFPSLLRESFVYRHHRYDPSLANYTARPAVHWFTYSRLCALGRDAGFAKFFSPLDVKSWEEVGTGPGAREKVKRFLARVFLTLGQRSAIFRTIALTQAGHDVVMWKRGG